MIARKWMLPLIGFTLALGAAAQEAGNQPASRPARLTVGILLFEGVQIIDFTGPYEVFGQAGMKVWTASVDGKPLTTGMGMLVTPTYALADAPAADIVVLPGGNVPHRVPADDPRLAWIKKRAAESRAVLSVCNGVFYLTSAGLLDGKRATTYALMLDHLAMMAPDVIVVDDERVVDNGKFVTAGGLSAGIDGALHLVTRFLGEARARSVANNMEYDWRPDREYNRAKLADVHIHALIDFFPPLVPRTDEAYEGDEDRWRLRWRVYWSKPVEEMRRQFVALATEMGWRPEVPLEQLDWNDAAWSFADRDGRPWRGLVSIVTDEVDGAIVLDVAVRRTTEFPAAAKSPGAAR